MALNTATRSRRPAIGGRRVSLLQRTPLAGTPLCRGHQVLQATAPRSAGRTDQTPPTGPWLAFRNPLELVLLLQHFPDPPTDRTLVGLADLVDQPVTDHHPKLPL